MGRFHFLDRTYYTWEAFKKAWYQAVSDGEYIPSEREKRFMNGEIKFKLKRGKLVEV